jgi:hypothetical protein
MKYFILQDPNRLHFLSEAIEGTNYVVAFVKYLEAKEVALTVKAKIITVNGIDLMGLKRIHNIAIRNGEDRELSKLIY